MEILQFLRESAAEYPCPSCQASLAGCGIDLLRTEGNVYTVEVTCSKCAVVFLVVLKVDVEDETPAAQPVPPITGDELLEVHEALAAHSGPLTQLFTEG